MAHKARTKSHCQDICTSFCRRSFERYLVCRLFMLIHLRCQVMPYLVINIRGCVALVPTSFGMTFTTKYSCIEFITSELEIHGLCAYFIDIISGTGTKQVSGNGRLEVQIQVLFPPANYSHGCAQVHEAIPLFDESHLTLQSQVLLILGII